MPSIIFSSLDRIPTEEIRSVVNSCQTYAEVARRYNFSNNQNTKILLENYFKIHSISTQHFSRKGIPQTTKQPITPCPKCKERPRRIPGGMCVECYKVWRQQHIQKYRDAGLVLPATASMRRLRLEVLNYYGGKCACCGEDKFEFLAIDHINGGGTKHRKEIGKQNFNSWLRNNGYPEGFRVLCHNCNNALGHYGYCPHERENDAKPKGQVSNE